MGTHRKKGRRPENTEAWIIGTGTASLATALYLINHAKLQPSKVHILDKNPSMKEDLHNHGHSSSGYDQFAGCLPVPVGSSMKELLAMIPSAELRGKSFLDEIQMTESSRLPSHGSDRTCFVAQKNGTMLHMPIKSLSLSYKYRAILIRLLLKREKSLLRRQICDVLPESFFDSFFWLVWSTQ
jgi:oleate hydratase